MEEPVRVPPVAVQISKLPKLVVRLLLRTPGHVHAHWDFVLDRHCQKRGRVDFEIGECGRNCPCDVSFAAVHLQF